MPTITGTDLSNVITIRKAGAYFVYGLGGKDTITVSVPSGSDLPDWLDGGDGDDIVRAGRTADTVIGGLGKDNLRGDAGNDLMFGDTAPAGLQYGGSFDGAAPETTGDGADTLDGGDGDDRMYGGGGNDLMLGGRGADVMFGGSGDDTMTAGFGGANGEADTLHGGDGDDTLMGGPDSVMMYGDAGNDEFYAGSANDALDGGDGDDELNASGGDDELYGGNGDDILRGGLGADLLEGGDGADLLDGSSGNDTMNGGAGDDTFLAGAGVDAMDGGDGIDTADYSSAAEVGVDLTQGIGVITGSGETDTLTRIENVIGTDGADFLIGDAANNVLTGGLGADRLEGRDGGDRLIGGGGADIMLGGLGADVLHPGADSDIVDGGGAADTIALPSGKVVPNVDFVTYAGSGAGVAVTLTTAGATTGSGGDAQGDTFQFIEGVEGSAFNDTLIGVDGSQALVSGLGTDIMRGGPAADTIVGNGGVNLMFGQGLSGYPDADRDYFVSLSGTNYIYDFQWVTSGGAVVAYDYLQWSGVTSAGRTTSSQFPDKFVGVFIGPSQTTVVDLGVSNNIADPNYANNSNTAIARINAILAIPDSIQVVDPADYIV